MKAEELAAYIGAAAWLPQIARLIYWKLTRPVVTIIPDKYAEVGFTSYGPIFNLKLAFLTEKVDLVVDGFELLLTHSDGDSRTFRWSGLSETFSEITDTAGNRQIVSRDQTPIALKVGTKSLIEKFVRFQEPKFHEKDRPAWLDLVAHFNFLKQSRPDDFAGQALSSKELFSVIETRRQWFWWKPGRYSVTMNLSSPSSFKLTRSEFYFELTPLEVERLKRNLTTLDIELRELIESFTPNHQRQNVTWNWANVDVHKVRAD